MGFFIHKNILLSEQIWAEFEFFFRFDFFKQFRRIFCVHQSVVRSVVVTGEDAHVFGTSVLENLRVARGDVTPEEATDALRRTGLGAWLAGLPDGLGTVLGSDARTVSGGERRRLLLARALLSDAPILLLDEATSALDEQTEAKLLKNIDAMRDKTVIIVTHRRAALAICDYQLHIENGRMTRIEGNQQVTV